MAPAVTASFLLAFALAPASGASTAELEVRVRTAGQRHPVSDVRVSVVPDATEHRVGRPLPRGAHLSGDVEPEWMQTAVTTKEGEAAFDAVPHGQVRVVVVAPGYERLEQLVRVPLQRNRPLWLSLTPDLETTYRTVVEAPLRPRPKERVTSHLLSREEIATLPGTQGDPLRALQNLPGVARTPGGLGLLVLRGAPPNQSRVFYGEHALPVAFHAVAFASVVPADATDGIEFIPSNAPARYGETTGGAVVIEPRRPSRDGYHGFGEVDLTGAAALVQGPVGNGSFLAAVNRGWVDWALRGIEELAGEGTTFVLPKYVDYQGLLDYPLGSGGSVGVRLLGSRDLVASRAFSASTGERETQLEIETAFHRADLVFRRNQGPWRFLASPSFRFQRDRVGGFSERNRNDYIFSWRAEVRRRVSTRASVLLGTDAEVDSYRADTTEVGLDSLGSPVENVRTTAGVQTGIGLYAVAETRLGRVSLWPGVRLSMFSLGSDADVAFDPRLSGRWDLADRWWIAFGAGLYSQAVVPQTTFVTGFLGDSLDRLAGNVVYPAALAALEPRAGFEPAGDEIAVARAAQASTGVGFVASDAWSIETTAFGRLRDNAGGSATVRRDGDLTRIATPITYDTAYGFEALVRRRPVGRWYGWLAYTLSRTDTRVEAAYASRGPLRPGAFDQRHVLALVASVALPRRWRFGGRFRLVSGSPYRPVVGVFDNPPQDSRRPIYGEEGSARFPVFHQLDLRVDRQWLFRYVTLTMYLDVQNVYNWFNVEAYIYSEDYGEPFSAVGLPVLPSLGVRVDF